MIESLRFPSLWLSVLCVMLFLPGVFSVPPLDRDESRFAQASKQMVETGDYVRIQFQETARNKKPAGAYWAQATAAKIFLSDSLDQIWAYRVPSVLAAWLGILAFFAFSRRWLGDRVGFLAAALMASSMLLILEAHQAKADALLFLAAVVSQAALGMLYVHHRDRSFTQTDDREASLLVLGFWIAQGCALLIKGPIVPMISALTLFGLVVADRDWRWLKSLRPGIGIVLITLIAAPWFIAIAMETGGSFIVDALQKDLLAKIGSGQESHGAPPGYYTALVHVMLWPAAALLWPALLWAWRNRSEAWVRFALAWLIPAWLVFEAVPTKLPHYVLPLYPALVLLIARFIGDAAEGAVKIGRVGKISAVVIAVLLPLFLSIAAVYAPIHFYSPAAWLPSSLVIIFAALTIALTLPLIIQRDFFRAMTMAIITGALVFAATLEGVLPRLDGMWLSRSVTEAISHDSASDPGPVASAGFHEPSLVFLTDTQTQLVNGGAAAAWLAQNPGGYAVVAEEQWYAFAAYSHPKPIERIAVITGINYSRDKPKRLSLYRRAR